MRTRRTRTVRLTAALAGGLLAAAWPTYADWAAGTLYELDPAAGAVRNSLGLGTSLPHFASLAMTGSHAYLGTSQGVMSVAGA